MSRNVELIKEAKKPHSFDNYERWLAVKNASLRPCVCTDEMKARKRSNGVMCKPCCARTIINGVASLGEII